MTTNRATNVPRQRLDTTVSISVFLFFAMMLSVPRGYDLGAAMLFVTSLCHLLMRPVRVLSPEDRSLMWLMMGVFIVGAFSYFYHDNSIKSLDLDSRYLMAIPILILLINRPPKAGWVWAGLIVGCVSAAGVALWQIVMLDMDRASGTTGGIQFGNLGLMMGIFCFAGAIGAGRSRGPQRTLWCVLLAVGAVAGLYTSIASGSRGGWVALPIVIAVFVGAYVSRQNIKRILLISMLALAAIIASVATVPTLEDRYNDAVSDIELYQAGNPYTSLGQRLAMYEFLSVIIPQKPWLGWSYRDYVAEQERLVNAGEMSDAILNLGTNTHNTYLEAWVFMGVLGPILLIVLFATAFAYFIRRLRSQDVAVQTGAVCGAILMVGYGVASLTQQMLGRNNTLLFFLMSMAVFWAMTKPTATTVRKNLTS